jgi:hypothetical protein
MIALTLVIIAGCETKTRLQSPGADKAVAATSTASPQEAAHGHRAGAHGGNIVEIGRDNYHAEAVFEKGGTVRLYLLGKDEARVQEIEAQVIPAYAKADGANEAVAFSLQPAPQADDAAGKTSQFIGRLPRDLAGRKVEVTVPSIRINGERFRFAFASATGSHEEAMPSATEDAEARQLYLIPGGMYTQADIEANGSTTAAEKYKGIVSNHDMKPMPGDKLCPVTATKANPQFTWVIGGKTYAFCCPPCIDEFVQLAKEQPDQIKDPREYVKRK